MNGSPADLKIRKQPEPPPDNKAVTDSGTLDLLVGGELGSYHVLSSPCSLF